MNSPVEKIKERLSVVDVLSSYLTVEKAGKNFKAKCPFHNEKTPSFFISPERGSYYCFGCGAKGDIFSFVEHFEGTDFKGSLKILAERAGVELTTYKGDKDNKEIYYEIMEEATLFYEKMFSKEARSYLISRGINDESISNFRIGYAPLSWTSVLDHLTKKGYKKEDIETVGLIKKKDNRFYDRFRGRVMFPISDTSGRVIAFSGRILEKGEEAKYLNSPDTPLFNKSNILFGIDKAKIAIRSRDYSIIVEGQMDLILSHQAGLTNTVAVSGTAFTDTTIDNESKINNLGLVRRLSQNVIFAFDGDDAGIRAASRSAMIALSLEMQVKVAVLPIGKDPADLILEDPNKWKEIIRSSVNIISFHLDRICKGTNDTRIRGKKVREIIFPFLLMIKSQIEKSSYISEIHQKTSISENAIVEDFKSFEKTFHIENKENKQDDNKKETSRKDALEKRLFGIVFWGGENDEEKAIINNAIESFRDSLSDKYEKMVAIYEPFSEKLVFEAETWYSGKTDVLIKDLDELILNLEEEILNQEASLLLIQINEKEKTKNRGGINDDIKAYQKIVEKIGEIKNRRLK